MASRTGKVGSRERYLSIMEERPTKGYRARVEETGEFITDSADILDLKQSLKNLAIDRDLLNIQIVIEKLRRKPFKRTVMGRYMLLDKGRELPTLKKLE